MAVDFRFIDKEGALHSTKTIGHKMTSFFTGIKEEQSKSSIIKICCNKSVISMSKSWPSAKWPLKIYAFAKSHQLRRLVCNPGEDFLAACYCSKSKTTRFTN